MSFKTKLLFVDDEEAIQNLFLEAMMNEGLLIETASDGKEALMKLKTFPADIVITDVMMPNMGGLELLEEIRIRYPEIFFLIITGYGSIDDAVKAMKAGAYDYNLKPFDFDVVRMVIEKLNAHKRILDKNFFLERIAEKNIALRISSDKIRKCLRSSRRL